jgi:hypothetical protein
MVAAKGRYEGRRMLNGVACCFQQVSRVLIVHWETGGELPYERLSVQ